MDNRWRFLYCFMTELRGRMKGARAGKGKTGASAAGGGQGRPSSGAEGAKRSGKE